MGRGLFIAGIGTDVGKTYVAASLLSALRARAVEVDVLKPVASGVPPWPAASFASTDTARLLTAIERVLTGETIADCTPWRFAQPWSPDLAARHEGQRIELDAVAAFCRRRLATSSGLMLIEGAGGVMSPLTEDGLNIDLAVALDCPVVLVAGTYLGAISHTLSALVALHQHGLEVLATIVNDTPGAVTTVQDAIDCIARFDRRSPRRPMALIGFGHDAGCPPELLAGIEAMIAR